MADARFTISAESAEALANLDKVAREFRKVAPPPLRSSGGAINAGLAKSRAAVTSIRDTLAQTRAQFIALFAVFQTGRAASGLIELESSLAQLSQQTGPSVERLNALRFAAARSDIDLNALARALAKLSVLGAESGEAEVVQRLQ